MRNSSRTPKEEQRNQQQADPCTMVIFGATGDLTKRKLVPALYNLARQGLLSENFAVVAFARRDLSAEEFRKKLCEEVGEDATGPVASELRDWLMGRLYYHRGDLQDTDACQRLGELLAQVDRDHGTRGNYFYYLATAPEFFAPVTHALGQAGLTREENGSWRRVVYEKPFGHDIESARKLNREVLGVLSEKQVYRIDHYLGKETVQNILVFRFANGIFEPVWNRRYVDHVQITVAESLGVEDRGGYYEQSGALRDMVPNHIFQLITLTAMEPPISFEADAVRDEQTKVLRAIQRHSSERVLSHTVRGQYGPGKANGREVGGYRSEPRVAADSKTETFVAMKLHIENWRWADVPFYIRTGKRLPTRHTEIAIHFKRAPFVLFEKTPVERLRPNELVLHLQPDEGISLSFGAKIPGPVVQIGSVHMRFNYEDHFGTTPSTGYERLLYDGMLGDATLFQRADMVETSWCVVEPILDVWQALPPRDFPNYDAGTWGPPEADELMSRDGRAWRNTHE